MFSYVTVYVTDVTNCWRYDWNLKGNTVYLSLSSKSSRGDTRYSNDLSGDHVIMYWIKSSWIKDDCTLELKTRNWSVLWFRENVPEEMGWVWALMNEAEYSGLVQEKRLADRANSRCRHLRWEEVGEDQCAGRNCAASSWPWRLCWGLSIYPSPASPAGKM